LFEKPLWALNFLLSKIISILCISGLFIEEVTKGLIFSLAIGKPNASKS
jgi:hypothetical protein